MIHAITDPQVVVDMVTQMHALLRGMEKSGKPVVCALNGTALGGGLEIALACHYRIAINNPKTKFGQPEVKLGLLPGGGATQRIPRIMGMQASMPILLEGKELRPDAAKAAGLVHELVNTKEELLARAKAWCLANPIVSSVIVGPRTSDQFEDNFAGLELTITAEDEAFVNGLVPPGEHSGKGFQDTAYPITGRGR